MDAVKFVNSCYGEQPVAGLSAHRKRTIVKTYTKTQLFTIYIHNTVEINNLVITIYNYSYDGP